jgi:hypothetical protein
MLLNAVRSEIGAMVSKLFIVDYDIPIEVKNRRTFYRRLRIILEAHGLIADKSTQSVWFVDNREIAEAIYALASRYGSAHLYEAVKLM